jgi:hypothetical protein
MEKVSLTWIWESYSYVEEMDYCNKKKKENKIVVEKKDVGNREKKLWERRKMGGNEILSK